MATVKGKPPGYVELILAMDCETSGLAYGSDDPSIEADGREYQCVSWGMIVANADTLEPIEELYVEIKWNGEAEWSMGAQNVHGLTLEYLEENGVDEEEAVAMIANLIVKYWGPDNAIMTLGHNVVSFDLRFLKRMMRRHGIELRFGNRHVDTSTVGFVNYQVYTSDQLFGLMGYDQRADHNALDDVKMSLDSARQTRLAFKACLG